MTGRALMANYGKYLACLALALVPGMFGGGLLLLTLLGPPWRLPPVWAGSIGVAACALLSVAIFGLALRSGRKMPLRVPLLTAALVLTGAALPILPRLLHAPLNGLNEMGPPLAGGAAFLLLLYPLCALAGERRVGWTRVAVAGSFAFAATICGMLYVLRVDRHAKDEVIRLLLVALLTLGFLPFAGLERAS